MLRHRDFCAFILTHGRAGRVYTTATLKRCGYTGPLYYIVDDEDDQLEAYREEAGSERVWVFSKADVAAECDEGDNFRDRRAIIYARNAAFTAARELGYRYFIELDDDYTEFVWKFDAERRYCTDKILNLDAVLDLMLDYYISCPPTVLTLAMAQGGDFIGGGEGRFGKAINLWRKAMNSFICSVERPFTFVGRINEDVNTYTSLGFRGGIFLTVPVVGLTQRQTQSNAGGMTELYLDSGTYVKSFYSVMYHPSGVRIRVMGPRHQRLHHEVSWNATAPVLLLPADTEDEAEEEEEEENARESE